MKTSAKIILDIVIGILVVAAVAGATGTAYFYNAGQTTKAEKAKAVADGQADRAARQALEIQLAGARNALNNSSTGIVGAINRHPLTGMTPVEITKLALALRGVDVSKFKVIQSGHTDAKSEVWVGPAASDYTTGYYFARQGGEWVLFDIKPLVK